MPTVDFDATWVRNPENAAKRLAWHRRRVTLLATGLVKPGRYESIEEHAKLADRYEAAFRAKGLCLRKGCELRDPLSVWRGYGPECWKHLTPDEQEAAEARAFELNGPRPGATEPTITTTTAETAAALDELLERKGRA